VTTDSPQVRKLQVGLTQPANRCFYAFSIGSSGKDAIAKNDRQVVLKKIAQLHTTTDISPHFDMVTTYFSPTPARYSRRIFRDFHVKKIGATVSKIRCRRVFVDFPLHEALGKHFHTTLLLKCCGLH